MTKDELDLLLTGGYTKAVEKVKSLVNIIKIEGYLKEYDPKQHDIFDRQKRPDKSIIDKDGRETFEPVTRLAVALQKLIVSRAASFLCGNPIELAASPANSGEENLLQALRDIWRDNKLDYKSKKLARLMMSETSCAELWYVVDRPQDGVPIPKLRVRLLAKSLGDDLYPVFDATGDMIAFGRRYIVTDKEKPEEHFDVYTDDKIYEGVFGEAGWTETNKPNTVGKIPVIYYSQDVPEWSDVQEMICQLETVLSNSSDTNRYFGDPMAIIEGIIQGFAKKGQSGKLLQLEKGAKISYLTWDQVPEPVKMEVDNLFRLIYSLTDTPDISFEQMKAIMGGAPSGYAIELLFLSAHLKASMKEEIFGESVQRRINFLIAAIIRIIDINLKAGSSLDVRPKFEYFLPKNIAEKIRILNNAVAGGIMSIQTAIEQNPLVEDAATEEERIRTGGLDQSMKL